MLRIAIADTKRLAVRDAPRCGGAGNATWSGTVADVIACFNYLVSIGHADCPAVSGLPGPGYICQAGDVWITTWNTYGIDLFTTPQVSAWYVAALENLLG